MKGRAGDGTRAYKKKNWLQEIMARGPSTFTMYHRCVGCGATWETEFEAIMVTGGMTSQVWETCSNCPIATTEAETREGDR